MLNNVDDYLNVGVAGLSSGDGKAFSCWMGEYGHLCEISTSFTVLFDDSRYWLP